MDTRREFLKKAVLLSGAAGFSGGVPASIARALAIDPKLGSTYLDAEHVVILMQENRSFDHCFGTLRGVRGFNDPRAITLPDKNLVWLQTNKAGETYAPFRFDIRDTKITWMGSSLIWLTKGWAMSTPLAKTIVPMAPNCSTVLRMPVSIEARSERSQATDSVSQERFGRDAATANALSRLDR